MEEQAKEKEIQKPRRFSIFWPVMLIALGIVLFLQNTSVVPSAGWDLLKLWPLLFIVGGLDAFWRGEGFVGGVFWIGVGGIFLLGNLGYLPGFSILTFIIRFWPILLVALGLDLIIGRRRVWSPVLGTAVGLVLVAGVAWLMLSSPVQATLGVNSQAVSYPAEGVSGADGSITMAVGKLVIAPATEAAQLVSGQVSLSNGMTLRSNFTPGVAGKVSFYLNTSEPLGFVANMPGENNLWDLKLSRQVPMSLVINSAVGDQRIDLSGLRVTDLTVNMAVGHTEVTLPVDTGFSGSIKGAVGETIIWLRRGTAVRFHLDVGLTNLSFPADWQSPGNGLDHQREVVSPNLPASGPVMEITLGQALGSVSVRYLE